MAFSSELLKTYKETNARYFEHYSKLKRLKLDLVVSEAEIWVKGKINPKFTVDQRKMKVKHDTLELRYAITAEEIELERYRLQLDFLRWQMKFDLKEDSR